MIQKNLETIAEQLENDFEASSSDDVLDELANETYYRSSRVRMYYSTRGGSTPIPFIELRVWVISEYPKRWQEELKKQLDYLEEFYFTSLEYALEQGEAIKVDLEEHQSLDSRFEARLRTLVGENIANVEESILNEVLREKYNLSMTIQGREDRVEIDGDEALISFYRTGLPKRKWFLDRIYRYGCKFDREGNLDLEYVESKEQFPYIHRIRELPPVDEQWEEYHRPKLTDFEDLQTLAMREYEELGLEWRTGYRADFYEDWYGKKKIVIRDARGRFVESGQLKPSNMEVFEEMKEKEEELMDDWEKFEG